MKVTACRVFVQVLKLLKTRAATSSLHLSTNEGTEVSAGAAPQLARGGGGGAEVAPERLLNESPAPLQQSLITDAT
jgi:hypothetical protein